MSLFCTGRQGLEHKRGVRGEDMDRKREIPGKVVDLRRSSDVCMGSFDAPSVNSDVVSSKYQRTESGRADPVVVHCL